MRPSILLVDDDADIRTIATMSLQTIGGMQVRAVASCAEALDALDALVPDLIVLDVMMPGVDGPSTLARIRARPDCRDVPVVFMTARTHHDEVQGYLAMGAAGVVPKPFDPIALADTLRGYLSGGGP